MSAEKPLVVVILGLPLSGKTELGRELSRRKNIFHLDIDEIPARCFPAQEEDPLRDEAARFREQRRIACAYQVLHAAIALNLETGNSLVVSAAYSRRSSREYLQGAIHSSNARVKIIECVFDDTPEEIIRRIDARSQAQAVGGCKSVFHYDSNKQWFEAVEAPHLVVNTSRPITTCVEEALRFIDGR